MSQRLTRKEIKRDEFASVVGRGVEYAESHARNLVLAVAGVALLAVIGFSVYGVLGYRSGKANDALARAMKVYSAPIDATGAKPNDAESPSFPDEASRRARAKTLFEKVRSDYGMTNAADVASLYLAQIAAADGKPDEARQLWSDFAQHHKDDILAGEARVNVLHLDRERGPKQKVEEQVQQLKAMLQDSQPPLPEDVILNELGAAYEQLGRKTEAVQSYQRILDEFPQSAYRSTAQQKISALDPTRPASPGFGSFPLQPGS